MRIVLPSNRDRGWRVILPIPLPHHRTCGPHPAVQRVEGGGASRGTPSRSKYDPGRAVCIAPRAEAHHQRRLWPPPCCTSQSGIGISIAPPGDAMCWGGGASRVGAVAGRSWRAPLVRWWGPCRRLRGRAGSQPACRSGARGGRAAQGSPRRWRAAAGRSANARGTRGERAGNALRRVGSRGVTARGAWIAVARAPCRGPRHVRGGGGPESDRSRRAA